MNKKLVPKVLVPLILQTNSLGTVVGLRLPYIFQNKTIDEILSNKINYQFYLDRKSLQQLEYEMKSKDIFLL